jgi:hypothetical protein
VQPADPDSPLASFGGGQWYDFTYVGSLKTFIPASQSVSIYLGLNYARGKTSQHQTLHNAIPGLPTLPDGTQPKVASVVASAYDNFYDNLYGADLYVKWKPPNVANTYASLAWQTEFFLRHIPTLDQLEGGGYTQLVAQLARRWYLGARGEILGLPAGNNVGREYAAAASLTWALSEFARARLYGEGRWPDPGTGRYAGFLQLEAAIGAHGAHPF